MPDNIKDDNANESLEGDLDLEKSDTDDVVGGITRSIVAGHGNMTKSGGNAAKLGGNVSKGQDTSRGQG